MHTACIPKPIRMKIRKPGVKLTVLFFDSKWERYSKTLFSGYFSGKAYFLDTLRYHHSSFFIIIITGVLVFILYALPTSLYYERLQLSVGTIVL
mmetsp:Transcript_6900/g.13002  ORF Transcript_6900/g.13002 Transcript_6900/m.13002 type:complete len:94 (+) Transcript_6900:790-1071(+)